MPRNLSKPQPAETKPRAGDAYMRARLEVKAAVKLPPQEELLAARDYLIKRGLLSFPKPTLKTNEHTTTSS